MDLAQFLVYAKQRTFSEGRAPSTQPDGAKMFCAAMAPYEYHDRYYGFDPFGGEEVVWQDRQPIWCMNYWGKTLTLKVSGGVWTDMPRPSQIYVFLRRALREVGEGLPLRGPLRFEDGEWLYNAKIDGTINSFSGREGIAYKGICIYECTFHGGMLREKDG